MASKLIKEGNEQLKKEREESPLSILSNSDVQKEDVAWMLEENELKIDNKLCCLIYGKDGRGKSGIALDYLTDEDIKNGRKIVIIDIDGGMTPLIKNYHGERVRKAKKKLHEVFIIKNPLKSTVKDGKYSVDYRATFQNILKMISVTRAKAKEWKIKAIIVDGVSTLLKYAEKQMRLEKNLQADGGVSMRYWLIRNALFEETIQQVMSLPINKIFIAHDDFILDGVDNASSIKIRMNAMMLQKIRCVRKTQKDSSVEFRAVIDKDKLNVLNENETIRFLIVNNVRKGFDWEANKVWKKIVG